MNKQIAIMAFGPVLSGKTTCLTRLSGQYDAPFLDMGTILRGMRNKLLDTTISADPGTIKFIDYLWTQPIGVIGLNDLNAVTGPGMVPDNIIYSIFIKWLEYHRKDPLILIAGVPRKGSQVSVVMGHLERLGILTKVVWLSPSRQACLERACNRPGREDEHLCPERFDIFMKETHPIKPTIGEWAAEFIEIDNSKMTMDETYGIICRRLHLGESLAEYRQAV